MSVLYILLVVSLLLGGGFLAVFIWAVRSGQFDDTGTPPMRMLTEDDGSQDTNVKTSEEQGTP